MVHPGPQGKAPIEDIPPFTPPAPDAAPVASDGTDPVEEAAADISAAVNAPEERRHTAMNSPEQAPESRPVKERRVGTFTFGAVLVICGALMLVSMFFPHLDLTLA